MSPLDTVFTVVAVVLLAGAFFFCNMYDNNDKGGPRAV